MEFELHSEYQPQGDQPEAIDAIVRSIEAGNCYQTLLGVTGSGKTEVYLDAVQRCIEMGRRAIVMVPEISLTPQTVERFAARFPGNVAVLHSGLSNGERLEQWWGVIGGEYDVVVGSRYVPGGQTDARWGRRRRLLSSTGNLYTRLVSGVRLRDPRSGFKGFCREVLENIGLGRLHSRGFVFQTEVASRCQQLGYRTAEVPILFYDRKAGSSKMSLNIIVEALWRLFLVRWSSRGIRRNVRV